MTHIATKLPNKIKEPKILSNYQTIIPFKFTNMMCVVSYTCMYINLHGFVERKYRAFKVFEYKFNVAMLL